MFNQALSNSLEKSQSYHGWVLHLRWVQQPPFSLGAHPFVVTSETLSELNES